jgi:hypothetical protein
MGGMADRRDAVPSRPTRTTFDPADWGRGSDLSMLDPVNAAIAGAHIDYDQAAVIAETLGFRVG